MSFLQNIYGVLFRPSETFRTLRTNYSPSLLLQGLLVFFFVSLISKGFDPMALLGSFVNWLFLCTLLFLAAYVFVLSRQDYWRMLSLLAYANLPTIFMAPLDLLDSSLPFLATILECAVVLWVLNLNLIAVSTVCNISKMRAFLLYLLVPLAVSYFVASVFVQIVQNLLF